MRPPQDGYQRELEPNIFRGLPRREHPCSDVCHRVFAPTVPQFKMGCAQNQHVLPRVNGPGMSLPIYINSSRFAVRGGGSVRADHGHAKLAATRDRGSRYRLARHSSWTTLNTEHVSTHGGWGVHASHYAMPRMVNPAGWRQLDVLHRLGCWYCIAQACCYMLRVYQQRTTGMRLYVARLLRRECDESARCGPL